MTATSKGPDVSRENVQTSCTPRVTSALSYAILLGGILTIVVALHMVVISYSSLPYWDGWTQISIVAGGESSLSPAWLWQQHNEHRLVIPKLFLAADLRLFGARQVFLLVSIFVIQLLLLALLGWSMWVLGGWRGTLWRTGFGLAAFCLFCPSQYQNFIWGFQVCFVLPQLFATLSFVALLLYRTGSQHPAKPTSSKFLMVSILAALGASYSLANGSLLWPLLIAAALYLRLRITAVLSFALTGVVSTGLYLYRYSRPKYHADPIASLGAPLSLLKYWALYFAGSWTHRDIRAPEIIALAVLALVILTLLPALLHARLSRAFSIQLVLTMAFCLTTALITAAGRLNFGLWQAFSSRYQTIALLFWCCLGLFLLGSTFANPRMPYSFLIAQVCLLAILVRGAALARYPIGDARKQGFGLNAAAAALLTKVSDPAQLKKAYPDVDPLWVMARYMKANQLSAFSDSVASQLGKPLESVFPLAGIEDCAGTLEMVAPIDETNGRGLRVTGWVWDLKHRRAASQVVVTTNGIITGLGAVGEWRPGVRAMKPPMPTSYIGYVGYLPEPPAGSLVNLYAILPGSPSAACYFATK